VQDALHVAVDLGVGPKGARGSENVRRWCGSRAATMAMIMTMKKMMSMAESLRSS